MNSDADKIAVVGMACRFPGARNLEEFWKILVEGKDTITHFTDEELAESEYDFENLRKNPDYVKAKGLINDIDKFDPAFFGYLPKEAEEFDPQYRIWLETVWHAFENAGCDPFSYKGKIGVFGGGSLNTYLLNNVLRDPEKLENYIRMRSIESFQTMIANEVSGIPTKTAYKLNLRGPAVNVQTACSTSLVAVSMACQSLLMMESDMCIAGGVTANAPQVVGYLYQEGGIPSPDGKCRPFDSEGKGTVFSNGVGVVALKRLEDAIRDNDLIYAVVSGWALNNDGNSKVSYTAPSIDGQTDVIMTAQAIADISPDQIGYIEAHGTATQLGDPIELRALANAFMPKTNRKQYCGIGSVKSNIGHLDTAAGIAGFIKASLSIYYKTIPATIHFKKPNPYFNFEDSPFYVQDKLKKWEETEPLIIGVSSFGVGGTNAHVILEEPEVRKDAEIAPSEWPELVVLSAKSLNSLALRKTDLTEYLKMHPELNIHKVAYTLKNGRNHMKYRAFTVVSDTAEMLSPDLRYTDGKTDDFVNNVAFMFPGQGAQYYRMGYDLYNHNNLFREILDDCFSVIKSETETDLKEIMFSEPAEKDRHTGLNSTDLTQPALFIIEYALAKVMMQLGVEPYYLIGHSIGEYTAACIAGVFDLHTALKIVLKRGMLMKQMTPGEMMAVRASRQKLESINQDLFEIAADNADDLFSISVKADNADAVRKLLDENGIQYTPLKTSHAFHSSDFDPMLQEFSDYVNSFNLNIPHLPFVSCLTGDFITDEQAVSGEYWAQQLRNTVHFRKGIATINEIENVVLLEVGPNTHLSSLAFQNAKVTNKSTIIHTLGKPDMTDERVRIISSLGMMFNLGIPLNLNVTMEGYKPQKISLPSYPFERIRCWIDFKYPAGGVKGLQAAMALSEDKLMEEEFSEQEIDAGTVLQRVTKIWESLFGMEGLKPDDNFFELGGHSLMALQILNRIKEDFLVNIPLKIFLENPTINMICSILDKESEESGSGVEMVHLTDLSNLPLSENQKRLWILYKMDNLNPAYNIPSTIHFKGCLDTDVFTKSINILFQRHHIMFSTFREKDGNVVCEIIPHDVNVEVIDFSNVEEKNRYEEILSFIAEDSRKSFNLETGPLYRLYLLKYDELNYYFHSTINHIVFDGWSWGVLAKDINIIYNSLIEGNKPELKELQYQYYDYASWQKSEQSRKNDDALTDFWTHYLKDCPPVLNFPFDRARVNNPTGFGGKEYIKIPEEETAFLKAISKKENSTIFATVLATLGVLIQKYSGDVDFCLGTPVANRPSSHLEDVFGMFINTIPVRMKIDDNISFNRLITETKNSAIEAISHQEMSFETIVEAINPVRSFNVNPFFQVCFAWQNNLSIPLDLTGIKGERVVVGDCISPFDLTFYMWENGDFIEGEVEYNSDILDNGTIKRLLNNFAILIKELVDNPDIVLKSVSMLSDKDKELIKSVNNTTTLYPKDKTIVQLFEDQVRLYPDKTAIVFKDQQMTYKQLSQRATQLAWTLRKSGVRANTPVAVIAEKSLDMIVATLGILKSGGGYVPIDPDYPEQRINFIINDSGCKILLIQGKYSFLNTGSIKRVGLDDPVTYDPDVTDIEDINNSSDLAYIMYTSGTTGMPKGSMIMQKSVIRLVRNTNYLNFTPDERILLTGAIVFDATTFEIWGALLNGGTLYIAEKETILNPKLLGEELFKNEITIMWLTSGLFTQIAEIRRDIFGKLKYLLTGGDVLSAPHINMVRKDNPDLKILNGYGPTENTTFSTTYLIEKDYDSNIPIGKPISNSTAYILDKNLNYQPIGILGELYVGGDGLSKGYLNREDLNAKSFIDDPHNPGKRLYKTGDFARWLPDGNIEFHGRIDNQLKIRGFRVELGEVESVISDMEGVVETVIKPIKINEGDIRLAAFLNISDKFNMDKKELSKQLKEKLPPYMIPSGFKFLKGFPKTVNGKTDKDKLEFDMDELVSHTNVDVESLTSTERKIHEIWCEALKTSDISPDDNFFDIGGSSLTAVSVYSKIESLFNVDLGLRVFFDSPKIRDLAEAIEISIHKKENIKVSVEPESEGTKIISGEI